MKWFQIDSHNYVIKADSTYKWFNHWIEQMGSDQIKIYQRNKLYIGIRIQTRGYVFRLCTYRGYCFCKL